MLVRWQRTDLSEGVTLYSHLRYSVMHTMLYYIPDSILKILHILYYTSLYYTTIVLILMLMLYYRAVLG